MRSVGPQFGSGKGVPRSQEALAALGVGESREKSVESREGNSDEIGLSAAEVSAARELEGVWNLQRMIAWAESFGKDEAWLEQTFEVFPDGRMVSRENRIELKDNMRLTELPPFLETTECVCWGTGITSIPETINVDYLSLGSTDIKEIPKKLRVPRLSLRDTHIESIPDGYEGDKLFVDNCKRLTTIGSGVKLDELYLQSTPMTHIPSDLRVRFLRLDRSAIKELPTGFSSETLGLEHTKLEDLPEGLDVDHLYLFGAKVRSIPSSARIGKIYAHPSQKELIAAATAMGIEVSTDRS